MRPIDCFLEDAMVLDIPQDGVIKSVLSRLISFAYIIHALLGYPQEHALSGFARL